MGGRYQGKTDRELSSLQLQVFKSDVGKAVKLLGDLVSSSTFTGAEFEATKLEVADEHE